VVHRPAYQQRDGDVIVRLCMCARARVQAHTDAPRLCARVSVCRLADRAALRGCRRRRRRRRRRAAYARAANRAGPRRWDRRWMRS